MVVKHPIHASELAFETWYAGDNTGTEACTYLIVGERIGDDEVVYPSGS
jgi:hypothetical protein